MRAPILNCVVKVLIAFLHVKQGDKADCKHAMFYIKCYKETKLLTKTCLAIRSERP